MIIKGIFNDGTSSQQHPATLTQAGPEAVSLRLDTSLSDDGPEKLIDVSALSISSRIGHSARYIGLGELGRFETRDNDAVDALASDLDIESGLLHTLESNLSLIVIAVLITVVVSWATIRYGVPAAADAIVNTLPEKTTDYLEQKLVDRLEQELFKPTTLSAQRQRELEQQFKQVADALGIEHGKYSFKLRNATEGVGANALAFPNGTVIMTDQLVNLATSDQQIAGVMAHEIGHLDGKHSLRQIVRGSLFTFIIAFIAGDVSGASSAVLSAPVILAELRYSREFENQADDYAMRYFDCDIEGLNAMGAFFLALSTQDDQGLEHTEGEQAQEAAAGESSWTDFLTTHPASEERQQRFEQRITQHCQSR